MTLEELEVILKLNNEQLISGLQQSMAQLNKMNSQVAKSSNSMKSSFNGLKKFIIGLGIGKVLKDSIVAGMESIESENRFTTLFKGYSDEMRAWSQDLQKAFGINEYSTRSAAATFYELVTAQGVASETAKDMAKNMTMAAYDIASFKDRDTSQVFNAMQSALVGNTEALRSMGYVVTAEMVKQEAYQQGIAATGTQLTQTQKAMATYSLIMKQAGAAHGDLARTINSPSNQLRILKDSLQQLRTEFGKAFTPILQVVLPVLNAFVQKLIQAAKIVAAFTQALFGKKATTSDSTQQIEDTTAGLGDLTGAYNDTADAAKKAAKQVMGFDEVNTLSDTSVDSNIGGVGDIEIPEPDITDTYDELMEIPPKVQEFADKVKAIFNNLKDFLTEHKEVIIAVVGGIVAAFLAFKGLTFLSSLPAIIDAFILSLGAIATPAAAAAAIIGALAGVFIYLWQTNDEFRNNMIGIWEQITGIFRNFWDNTLKPFVDFYINQFLIPLGEGFQTYLLPVFAGVFEGIGQILVAVLDLLSAAAGEILSVVQPAMELVRDVFIGCMELIYNFWKEHGEKIVQNVVEFVGKIKEEALKIWNEIIEPILIYAIEMLREVWENHLKGVIATFLDVVGKLINGAIEIYNKFIDPIVKWLVDLLGPAFVGIAKTIIDCIGEALTVICDVAGGILEALGGVIDFITGVFTGNWSKAWQGVVSIFEGIWKGIVAIVKYPLNQVINIINLFIRGLNKLKIPDWVPGIGGAGINIPEIPKLAQGGIINKPTTAIVGEAGPEMVVPLKNTPFVQTLANAVSSAVYASLQPLTSESQYNQTGGTNSDLILNVNGMTFGKVAIDAINQVTKANGKCLLRL